MNRSAYARYAGAPLCALALFALPAVGQVAAPSLVTLRPEIVNPRALEPDASSFTGLNPATMQWGFPSRFGYGQLESRRQSDDPPKSVDEEYAGSYGGFRWVTSYGTLGGDALDVHDREANLSLNRSASNGALSIPYDAGLAFGAAVGSSRFTFRVPPPVPPPGPQDFEKRADRTTVGVSFRWWEMVFLGIAVTREQREHKDLLNPTAPVIKSNRNIERYGLGFRKGGTLQMHLEYFVENKDTVSTSQPTPDDKDEQRQTWVAEFSLWGLLAAYRASTVERPDEDRSYDVVSYDAGWSPTSGLSILVHLTEARERKKNIPVPFDIMNRTRSIAVAWLF